MLRRLRWKMSGDQLPPLPTAGRISPASPRAPLPEFLIVSCIGVYIYTRKENGDKPLPSCSVPMADAGPTRIGRRGKVPCPAFPKNLIVTRISVYTYTGN